MKSRLDSAIQTTEHKDLFRHVCTSDCIAVQADRLFLQFVLSELSEPRAAPLAKSLAMELGSNLLEKAFHDSPILEDLAEAETEQTRLIRLITEVLKRRDISCQKDHTQTKKHWEMRTTSTQNALQEELKTTNISRRCEENVNSTQFTCNTNLMRNILIKQNPRTLVIQHERENIKVLPNTTPIARRGSQAIRTSKIIEKCDCPHLKILSETDHFATEIWYYLNDSMSTSHRPARIVFYQIHISLNVFLTVAA
ncbi:hypothetical protein KIN20_010795 [Parelaphostrongylus tenuis]|uniref:Uncharacterized protein n=1 Tax=Parelaphostrongylus tenuis TaxID=148309 RepID=A0AAD5MZE3_PARTN|nr:hypothetical protein KIN20_010795 [Parelaphostrongylus tenuis]